MLLLLLSAWCTPMATPAQRCTACWYCLLVLLLSALMHPQLDPSIACLISCCVRRVPVWQTGLATELRVLAGLGPH